MLKTLIAIIIGIVIVFLLVDNSKVVTLIPLIVTGT